MTTTTCQVLFPLKVKTQLAHPLTYSPSYISVIWLNSFDWYDNIDMIISIGINWANLLSWLQSWMTIQRVNIWYELNSHIDVIISYRYDHISRNGPFPLKVKWQMTQSFTCLLLYSTVIWVNWSYWYDDIDTITLTLIK